MPPDFKKITGTRFQTGVNLLFFYRVTRVTATKSTRYGHKKNNIH